GKTLLRGKQPAHFGHSPGDYFFSAGFVSSFFFAGGGTYSSGTPSFFAASFSLPTSSFATPSNCVTSAASCFSRSSASSCWAFVGAPSLSVRFKRSHANCE